MARPSIHPKSKKDQLVRAMLDQKTMARFESILKGDTQSAFLRRLIIRAIDNAERRVRT